MSWLVVLFYGVSTLFGSFNDRLCHFDKFQTIQFSVSRQLTSVDPKIGPYQVLPFRARVDQVAMAMKRYSAFPKDPESLETQYQIV